MKDNKSFVDTNILIYCYSESELDKKEIALSAVSTPNAIVSTQVLQEISNVLNKKFKLNWFDIERTIDEIINNLIVHINQTKTVQEACKIAYRYHYSFYDSLIIASAIESGCKTLYSEDLQHNQIIEKTMRIVNPFVSG